MRDKGKGLLQGLPEEGAHSKCLQTLFFKKAESQQKMRFGAERDQRSSKREGFEA